MNDISYALVSSRFEESGIEIQQKNAFNGYHDAPAFATLQKQLKSLQIVWIV